MSFFYIVVFLVGVIYTLVSLIISGISGAFHANGDIGAGGDTGAGLDGHVNHGHLELGHLDGGHGSGHFGDAGHFNMDGTAVDANHGAVSAHNVLSWFSIILNPITAVSFLTVFGGMGIMGINYFRWNDVVIFLVAIGSGIIVSTLLYNFVARPIYRSENSSNVSREELIGMAAEVTTDIINGGFGTIKYTVNSLIYTAPARHIDGKGVKQGERVFICKIEDNTFYISELSGILK